MLLVRAHDWQLLWLLYGSLRHLIRLLRGLEIHSHEGSYLPILVVVHVFVYLTQLLFYFYYYKTDSRRVSFIAEFYS